MPEQRPKQGPNVAIFGRPSTGVSPHKDYSWRGWMVIRWVVCYVRFHGTRHPSELGQDDVVEFLSALAIRNRVSGSTQNLAMAAISFLCREVLGTPLEQIDPIARAKRAVRLPVVLTPEEVKQVIARLDGTPQLVAMLLYGSGLQVLEWLQLH